MNNSTFEQELAEKGRIVYPNVGVSMRPLIRQGKDVMIIERPNGRLKRYDAALYKRRNGTYIMHRVLRVREKDYVICGDNCIKREYGITDDHIIGVLTGVIRGGKEIKATDRSYRIYAHLWCDFFYIKVAVLWTIWMVRKVFRKLKRIVTGASKNK